MTFPLNNHAFDYSSLEHEVAERVQTCTNEIRSLMQRTVEEMIAIGVQLQLVKQTLRHGHFQQWLHDELGMNPRQARRFMLVASQFKTDSLSVLNLQIAPTALYHLAELQTPEEARNEAISRARQGESITVQIAKEIVARHKENKSNRNQNHIFLPQPLEADHTKKQDIANTIHSDESNLRPEHATVEVMAETMPDDSPQDSVIPERIQAQSIYCVGDRICILRRQMGQDEWCGKIAQIWDIADDGWLRVNVEGHPGVKFTLHPNWVEPIDDITNEVEMTEPDNDSIGTTISTDNQNQIRVQFPIEDQGKVVDVEGEIVALEVTYNLHGKTHKTRIPASKVRFADAL